MEFITKKDIENLKKGCTQCNGEVSPNYYVNSFCVVCKKQVCYKCGYILSDTYFVNKWESRRKVVGRVCKVHLEKIQIKGKE